MRFTLSALLVVLVAAVVTPSIRAQASMPYRRTIPYISNRPYQPSGRYVRISVSGGPLSVGGAGRMTNSLTVQALIFVPATSSSLLERINSANDERRRGGP